MGIDWENILGIDEGEYDSEHMQEAYDDMIPDDDDYYYGRRSDYYADDTEYYEEYDEDDEEYDEDDEYNEDDEHGEHYEIDGGDGHTWTAEDDLPF